MATIAEQPPAETKLPPPSRQALVVQDDGPAAHLFDTARFEQMQRIARAMGASNLIPEHLQGATTEQTSANCLMVVNQAVRWRMDPYAVAPESYVVTKKGSLARGKLAFQGKLVAAVVNTRAGLVGRLSYTFEGAGDGRTVTVSGQFDNEDEPRTITLSVKQAKTDNTMWRTDPDQKLVYSGVTKWARRHCPEVMLGVLTDDDLDRMAIDVEHSPAGSLDDLTTRLEAPPADTTPPPDQQTVDASREAAREGRGGTIDEIVKEPPAADGHEAEAQRMAEEYYTAINSADTVESVDELVTHAKEIEIATVLGETLVKKVMNHGNLRKHQIERAKATA